MVLGTVILLIDFQTIGKMMDIHKTEGFIMILLAALTEAFIYFVVRRIKTDNHWNHIFISYFLGAIVLSVTFWDKLREIKVESILSLSLIINICIGLFGYLLRFFAMSNLDTAIYASLSYIGIVMAYVYGLIFNGEAITIQKIIGTMLIIFPNIYLLL
jgi:drug/metabolite transporter (DMT)-like permease